jgi:hypothetical protein
MTIRTKAFVATFTPHTRDSTKKSSRATFFSLAKKHIVKRRAGESHDLSQRIDEIVYGV